MTELWKLPLMSTASEVMVIDSSGHGIAESYGDIELRKKRTAFIVRACNSHDDLVKALEGLLDVCHCQNGCAADDMTCATNVAKAALKKAKQ